jgi:hypothetical protein
MTRTGLGDASQGVKWLRRTVNHAQAQGEAFELADSALGKNLKLRKCFVVLTWSIETRS